MNSAAYKNALMVVLGLVFAVQLKQCLEKYLDRKIVENVSVTLRYRNHLPAVTLSVIPDVVTLGISVGEGGAVLDALCPAPAANGTDDADDADLAVCLEGHLPDPMDQVKSITLRATDEEAAYHKWIPNFFLGISYTVTVDEPLAAGMGNALDVTLKVEEDRKTSIVATVHNRGHFIPGFVPSDSSLIPQHTHKYPALAPTYYDCGLSIRKRVNLDTEKRPCLEDDDYRFEDCFDDYIVREIGCRPGWSSTKQKKEGVRDCRTREEFSQLLQLHMEILYTATYGFFVETGCRVPCRLDDFRLDRKRFESPLVPSNESVVVFLLTNANEELVEQAYLYDFNSLVGEVGGSLGLFLGLSIVHVVEAVVGAGRRGMWQVKTFLKKDEDTQAK